MDINGASAIVTGGASGIGAAVARQLAAKGAKVVVADLNAEKGEALANEIGGVFAPVDVTKTEQIEAAIEQAEELGPVRVLVNSAGIGWAQRTVGRDGELQLGRRPRRVQQGDRDQPGRHLRLHPPRRYGDLAHRAAPRPVSGRHREHGQRRRLRRADRPGGVLRVQGRRRRDDPAGRPRPRRRRDPGEHRRPGLIDTPIYGEGEDAEAFKAKLGQRVLFPKRLGKPDELATMVIECITNSYMNAETIRVDGGIRMPPK